MLLACLFGCNEELIYEKSIFDTEQQFSKDKLQKRVTIPCEAGEIDLSENSIVSVGCLWDLDGATVILEPNIDFVYNGGDIINGTLIFNGGKIDGELLNSNLNIEGNVTMSSSELEFVAERWEVLEGTITEEEANLNIINFNNAIKTVHDLNGNSLSVSRMDAFFNVEHDLANNVSMTKNSILIPSNFHLKLGAEAKLRVFPTHMPAYALVSIYDTNKSKISGGHLIGDRESHDYSPYIDIYGSSRNTHEFGYLINIVGAHDVTVEGVTMSSSIGDGVMVSQNKLRNVDGSLTDGNRTTERLLILDCEVSEVRRNGISITDGDDVIIESCNIHHIGNGAQAYDSSGNKVYSSSGVAPKYGIDLEAYRERGSDGVLLEYQKVENVVINNCDLYENEAGDIISYTASYITIENCRMDKRLGTGHSNNVNVRNNIFINRELASVNGITAINVKSRKILGQEIVDNIVVSGNEIIGYYTGITLGGDQIRAENNKVTNCRNGISFGVLSNSEVLNNNIVSNLDIKCFGFIGYKSEISNVNVNGGLVDVTHVPILFQKINENSVPSSYEFIIKNVTLNSNKSYKYTLMYDSNNILFQDILSNTKLYTRNCFGIGLENAQFMN